MTAAAMPSARWAPAPLRIQAPAKPVPARISATFSRANAGDLDAFARAVYDTLAGTEVAVECADPTEARRMRARVIGICRSRIDHNLWFYVATRVTREAPATVFVWLEHRTEAALRDALRNWRAADVAHALAQAPLCELRVTRRSRTMFDAEMLL